MIKHFIFLLILTISLSALAMPAGATTYYVATNGNDTNDGSSDNPFRTIQKGIDSTSPGDTVYVGAGTFYEQLTFSTDGSSGSVITIDGVDGSTIVDGTDAVTGGSWASASEIGTGVYKQTSYAYEPGSMYVIDGGDAKDVPRCRGSGCLSGSTWMAIGTNDTQETTKLGVSVKEWDGIDAMFAHSGTTLYVRFADNSNPSGKTLRTSPDDQAVIDLTGDSYITVKDLEIRGGFQGIKFSGSTSNNNVVDNCTIYATGRQKIYIESSAHTIEIKNSTMHMGRLSSYGLGAFNDGTSDGSAPYAQAIKEWYRYFYKYRLTDGGSSRYEDEGIDIYRAGADITIHDNEIYDEPVGLTVREPSGAVTIYNNTIRNCSSIGLYGSQDSKIVAYGNTIYDNNINMRHQYLDSNPSIRTTRMYNNKFYNPDGIGRHLAFHFNAGSGSPSQFAELWFYHNSFAGGLYSMDANSYSDDWDGLGESRFINNIFSSDYIIEGPSAFKNNSSMVDIFAYNWVGGAHGIPAWDHEGNVEATGTFVLDNSSMPYFVLPAGHAARNAGIDVSSDFIINGRTYPPLPGMEPGYYENEKPDMGFDFPNPPENFRKVLN